MDPLLKQRLVGTAVLVALAVIFLPMILDGPPDQELAQRTTGVPLPLPDPVAPASEESRPASAEAPAGSRSHTAGEERRSGPMAATAPPAEPAPRRNDPVVATGWVVQVASFTDSARAEALSGRLGEHGFDSFVQRAELPNGTMYRVRIGPFAERGDAEALIERVARASGEPETRVDRHP